MSLYTYTIVSVVVIIVFIVANYHYGLPWHASIGLFISLLGCLRAI